MSIVNSSLFNRMKGSLGNVIVYEVNGQLRMRAKPSHYKKSKSESQQAQKNKFKAAATFYRKVGVPMTYTWDEATRGKNISGYNLFIKENIHYFSNTGEITEYAGLKICCGPLFIPNEFEMQYSAPAQIGLRWEPKFEQEGRSDDLLQIAIYDKSQKTESPIYWLEKVEAPRSAGECTFSLPEKTSKEIYLFAFFKSKYQNIFSDSRFVGTVSRDQ